MIRNVVKVFFNGKMEIFIREIIFRILGMDMDKCIGVMVVIIKDNGIKEFSMDMAKLIMEMVSLEKDYSSLTS